MPPGSLQLDGYGESMNVALRKSAESPARVRIAGFRRAGPYLLVTVESLEVPEEGPYDSRSCKVRKSDLAHVARWYSWSSPPSRSCRPTLIG